jgi:Holliday junction resolvasome RuvABC endonuclease subunit
LVILGLDPGFASLGWALLDCSAQPRCLAGGVIRTKPDRTAARCDDNVSRCGEIADAIQQIYKEHRFAFVAAEAQSWTRHANADRAVAQAWGVIAALSEVNGCPVIQLRPQDVKHELTGSRSTSKGALQNLLEHEVENARSMLSALAKSQQNHASDALAVALASLRHPLVQTVKRMRG